MRGAAVFFSSFCLTHPAFDGRPGRHGVRIVPVPMFPGLREKARVAHWIASSGCLLPLRQDTSSGLRACERLPKRGSAQRDNFSAI
jgi:hypothetical protein